MKCVNVDLIAKYLNFGVLGHHKCMDIFQINDFQNKFYFMI